MSKVILIPTSESSLIAYTGRAVSEAMVEAIVAKLCAAVDMYPQMSAVGLTSHDLQTVLYLQWYPHMVLAESDTARIAQETGTSKGAGQSHVHQDRLAAACCHTESQSGSCSLQSPTTSGDRATCTFVKAAEPDCRKNTRL